MLSALWEIIFFFNPLFDSSFCFFILKKINLTYTKYGNKISDIHLSHRIDECYFDFAKKFGLKSTCVKSKGHSLTKLIEKKECL